MSILIIVVFTTIAISIVGSKLVIFSEGQKAPSINTHNINNTSSNLIKWHIINASKGSTSITPAKSSNKITISDSGMETQQQSQLRAEPNASTIITTGSNATAKTKAPQSGGDNTHNSSSSSKTYENNSNIITVSGLGSNLTQTPHTYHYNSNNRSKSISLSIESSQNITNGKGTSIVKAIANDAATGKKIENAIVKLNITFTANGTSKEIVGHNGEAIYSIELKPNSNSSNSSLSFKTAAEASAPGYSSTTKTTTTSSSSFISTSTVISKNNTQKSIINGSSNNVSVG